MEEVGIEPTMKYSIDLQSITLTTQSLLLIQTKMGIEPIL